MDDPNPFFHLYLIFFFVFLILINGVYFAFFEASRKGATPGKLLMRLKVVDNDGQTINFGRAYYRYILRVNSLLLFGYGLFMIIWSKDQRAWHDRVSETKVIEVDTITESEKFNSIKKENKTRSIN